MNLRFKKPWRWLSAHRLILGIALLGAIVRLWRLGSLPPAPTAAEASNGLSSLNLWHHGSWWSWGITPPDMAYSWLSAPILAIDNHSLAALRLVAAAAGVVAVIAVYGWNRHRQNHRDGLITAIVLAGLAWAIATSREAGPQSLVPAVLALGLWLAARAGEGSWRRYGLAALGGLSLYVAPELWWLAGAAAVWLIISGRVWRRINLVPVMLGLIIALPAIVWVGGHWAAFSSLYDPIGAPGRLGGFLLHLVAIGGDWQQTIGSQPLLNAFYAVMAVLGLVIIILRKSERQILLPLFIICAVAGSFSPADRGLAICLVPVAALIAVGIATMLAWWYATFPINAAARSSGRTAIGLILVLAIYQGYVQYFIAYASSSQTFVAYREDAWAMGQDARAHPGVLVLSDQSSRLIITFATYPKPVTFVTVRQLADQPKAAYYLIGYQQLGAAKSILGNRQPGGQLRPHVSNFDGRDLYYSYQP